MRWLPEKIKEPELDAKRIIRKFAWFPISVQEWNVWLEFYDREQIWLGNSQFGLSDWFDSSVYDSRGLANYSYGRFLVNK